MVSGSRAEVASSESSTFGFVASARAMPTRCFCPPESSAGIAVALVGEADELEQFGSTRRRIAALLAARHLERQGDVVGRRARGEQIEMLEDHADGAARLPQLALGEGPRSRLRRRSPGRSSASRGR